jgi:hypothetical protein
MKKFSQGYPINLSKLLIYALLLTVVSGKALSQDKRERFVYLMCQGWGEEADTGIRSINNYYSTFFSVQAHFRYDTNPHRKAMEAHVAKHYGATCRVGEFPFFDTMAEAKANKASKVEEASARWEYVIIETKYPKDAR